MIFHIKDKWKIVSTVSLEIDIRNVPNYGHDFVIIVLQPTTRLESGIHGKEVSWWSLDMETLCASLALCEENPRVI